MYLSKPPVVSKKLLPDEAFINNITRTIYIIEKKFQHRAGSVDEKLQTCDFKLKQYKKLANLVGFDVEYIYIYIYLMIGSYKINIEMS